MKEKKDILLVEPDYKTLYPPIGLMKISTWHKKRGDRVSFVKGKIISKKKYDIIYITTLFTYFAKEVIETTNFYQDFYPNAQIKIGGIFASLLPQYIKKRTGVTPHIGLFNSAENCPPDYSLFPKSKNSIVFTTRGCFRKCAYCAVQKHEPKFFVKENWEKDVDMTKKRIIFWDNNWLWSPNFFKDIEKLRRIGKPFDFNQGLDAKLFTNEKAKVLSNLKIEPLRFAFDSIKDDKHVENAIKIAQKFGMKDIRVYILYNFKDSPEDFYYRINKINRLGALSYPMRYRSISGIENHLISENWDNRILRALKLILIFYYTEGMISKSRIAFQEIYGNSKRSFKRKLYEIYENDKKKNKKGREISLKLENIDWEALSPAKA